MIRRPPRSTLFPSPTLSRSRAQLARLGFPHEVLRLLDDDGTVERPRRHHDREGDEHHAGELAHAFRSEEHTSELQSRSDLVCRLLLEKKQKHTCSGLACERT